MAVALSLAISACGGTSNARPAISAVAARLPTSTTSSTTAPDTTTSTESGAVTTTSAADASTTTATAPEAATPGPAPAAAANSAAPQDAYHPDLRITPGAVFANVTAAQVCVSGYSKSVRHVSSATKNQVFALYGITYHAPGAYEVDHLISLELGGSNDIHNLWPEPYQGPDNAHVKDVIENRLHRQVCSGAITLAEAQRQIINWDRVLGGTAGAGAINSTPTAAAPPVAAAPEPASAPSADASGSNGSVYFANCTAARAAGAAPLHTGDPGYRSPLDRDGDGTACE